MTWANYDDVIDQLTSGGLILRDGLQIDTPRPVRCFIDGGDRERRGWFWLNEIELDDANGQRQRYITGAWGIYHGNDNGKQAVKLNRSGAPALTPAEREAIKLRHDAQMKRVKAIRAAEAKKAADQADAAWRKYLPTGESDYLKRKGVQGYGLRYSPSGNGTLAVPMQRDGRIVGLQIIRGKDRGSKLEKQYWPAGMDKVGAYHLIGGIPRGLVLVAEGYATAATLHEASGLPVAVAFDAGSLMPVVAALAKTYRSSKILICADDDYLTAGNPGVEAARLAATAHGAAYFKPEFAEERSTTKKGPTDFNDLHALEGIHVVRNQLTAALDRLGLSVPAAREIHTGGQGEPPQKKTLVSLLSVGEATERFALIYGGKGTLFAGKLYKHGTREQLLMDLPSHGKRVGIDRPGNLVTDRGDNNGVNLQRWTAYANTAASTAISNTAAETEFSTSYTIPANTLVAGEVIDI